MEPKVLIVISSSDREKVWTGLLYAVSALSSDWMGSTKVIIWGPACQVVPQDRELKEFVKEIQLLGETVYVCRACSDKYSVSDKLSELGCQVEYVGPISSKFIGEGYPIFNW